MRMLIIDASLSRPLSLLDEYDVLCAETALVFEQHQHQQNENDKQKEGNVQAVLTCAIPACRILYYMLKSFQQQAGAVNRKATS